MKGLNFGVIGIGQGGVNIADTFAKTFPAIAINTAPQDLAGLKNIPQDLRIHTKINEGGGAGKDIRLGEEAIISHESRIVDTIRLNMGEVGYIWLCVGLGGGTGTLGVTQLVRILAGLGKKHGIICTLPTPEEGTNELVNAVAGVDMIERAREKFQNLRAVIMIDNHKLKNYILENHSVSYENTWEKANEYIYNSFYDLYAYSQKASIASFDTTDYMRLFDLRGYMSFGKGKILDLDEKSETALAGEVKKLWQNGIFPELKFNLAKGVAVVVNRPSGYDKDGRAINLLFREIKNYIGAGSLCKGVYSNNNRLAEIVKKPPVEIFTLLAGMPLPYGAIEKLHNVAHQEAKNYKGKEVDNGFKFDKNLVMDFVGIDPGKEEIDDFRFFKERQNLEPVRWENFAK